MLTLRKADADAMLEHARRAAPREACGVLGGRDVGSERRVEVVMPCRNAHGAPEVAYALDPLDQLRAYLAIEDDKRLGVLGVYHSHPRGPQEPSPVDAAEANLPGATYVVIWLAPAPGWGAWRWKPPVGFEPEPVRVTLGS